jgi:hypothetical protein
VSGGPARRDTGPGTEPVAGRERRELAYSLVACLGGAGLAAAAAGDLAPWVRALALVGLAGGGALLAARGAARTALGALLAAGGAAVTAGGGLGDPLVAAGGLGLAAGGAFAAARGRRWPALGARYERRGPGTPGAEPTSLDAWTALDRGEDPTVDPIDDPTDEPPADRRGD